MSCGQLALSLSRYLSRAFSLPLYFFQRGPRDRSREGTSRISFLFDEELPARIMRFDFQDGASDRDSSSPLSLFLCSQVKHAGENLCYTIHSLELTMSASKVQQTPARWTGPSTTQPSSVQTKIQLLRQGLRGWPGRSRWQISAAALVVSSSRSVRSSRIRL